MEAKKRKRLWIIVPLVCVIVIAASITTFFALKKKNERQLDADNQSVSNVSFTGNAKRDFEISQAIINEKYDVNYDGNYKYNTICSIEFDSALTEDDIKEIYKSRGCEYGRTNDFRDVFLTRKKEKAENEYISINHGKFNLIKTNEDGSDEFVEVGIFFGNLDKSEVYILNENGKLERNGYHYSYKYDISQTGYKKTDEVNQASLQNVNGLKLYLTETIYNDSRTAKLLYITYVYDLVVSDSGHIDLQFTY